MHLVDLGVKLRHSFIEIQARGSVSRIAGTGHATVPGPAHERKLFRMDGSHDVCACRGLRNSTNAAELCWVTVHEVDTENTLQTIGPQSPGQQQRKQLGLGDQLPLATP